MYQNVHPIPILALLLTFTKGDEAKPDCNKCRSRGEDCEWDTGITFRLTGLDPQHPSMLQARVPKPGASQNGLRVRGMLLFSTLGM
jgi:hypothetical protein